MKILLNNDTAEEQELVDSVKKALKENDGYCPCMLEKTEDTKCMCRKFREMDTAGECHCGLYKKVEV